MSKKKSAEFQSFPMPTGSVYEQLSKLHAQLQKDERYQFARSCRHCNDTADSFNRYVSTYCHARQENIQGKLGVCESCEFYQSRGAA